MSRTTAWITGAAALAAAAAVAAPVAAQSAKPVPCVGVAQTDPAGDQEYHVPQVGVPTGQEAAPLTDMTGIFFRADGSKVTANLMISELSKTVPDEASAIRWSFYYTVGEAAYYLRVVLWSDGEIEYLYGEDDGATLTELGTTTGAFHEGADGVISLVMPAAVGGKAGTSIEAANAIAAYQFPGGPGSSADFLPDEDAFTAKIEACPTTGDATPTPTPTDPGQTTPPPASGGGGGGGSTNPANTQSDLRISASPTTLRAKRIKRGRAIKFRLSSPETLTSLTATLRRGTRSMGSGKLARLAGSGTLKLKPKRRVRKGSYTLLITATRSNGSRGVVPVKIRVR